MRPELETYQLIDNYLNGTLTGEALQAFEQRLHSDPSFAEEVSFQQLTNEVVIGASFDSLRTQMTQDIKTIDASTNTKYWGLAGIVVCIVGAGIMGIYTFSKEEEPAAVVRPAVQQTPELNNQRTETVAPAGEQTTAQHTVAKPEQILRNTDLPQSQQTENNPVQTPVQQHTSGQSATEKIIIKPVETIPHTPVSKTDAVTDLCDQVHIKAAIVASPSCSDGSNGSISIPMNQISGGSKPYLIAFNKSKDAGKKELYSYLAPGTYTITVTDANGCAETFHSEVTEKNCRKASFVFAPDKGQVCTITGKENQYYTLTIVNMAGKQVYKTPAMEGSFEWQGLSQQGEYLDAGLYIYILEYTSGEKENGQITIVR